jgi:adenine/guanine/hypoxanthine permease
MLERLFKIKANNTSLRIEVLAGTSTFLTMSYIIFINPVILSQTGMDPGAIFVATCLAAAIGSFLMGLVANYPIALAPGMALNAYFTYGVVLGTGIHWQIALGLVFIASIIFLSLSIFPIRKYIINCIPASMKLAMVAGVGLFICFIGFKSAGIISANPSTLVTLGNLHAPTTLLAIVGFFIIISLDALDIMGSIIISILFVTVVSTLLGYNKFYGIFSMPPRILPTFMQMNVTDALRLSLMPIILAFLFVTIFDNTGTLIGVAHKAGLLKKSGKLPRLNRALFVDSAAAVISPILGTSTTTSYIESAIGVKAGGKTGLTAITVAILFLFALFFSPLAQSIPIYATAPALIYVACLMMRALTEINWEDVTEYVPAIITAIAMPLTFSIAEGISFGFISYVAIKIISGRLRDLNFTITALAIILIIRYVFLTYS